MGFVHGVYAGHGCEPRREQHLDCTDDRRGFATTDAEPARFFAGVVTRWKDDCILVVAKRGLASLFVVDGWRRSETVDPSFDGRGHREMVAGWKDDCVDVGSVSGLQRR